ncbi:hypothetical protein B0H11DRAFT_2094006 [Mycena galericulata]|nr:hypothetical protein B0H11DRAFT_2094006 [Mycena galericulata]
MYRFGGCYSSVEDFIENGDWNDMKRLEHSPLGDPGISVNSHDAPSARGSGTGFRTAANQPYQKRTLWDMGHSKDSWGYEARIFRPEEAANVKKEFPEWGSIPDDQLPEPWSCNWARWGEWFGFQDDLDDVYGMANLRPVMFIPYMYDRGPMILSHEGIYYLLGETEDATLMRFEGTYASDQDFVENGDWNRTETVEPFQWEEIEEVDQDVGSDKGNDAFDKGCKL